MFSSNENVRSPPTFLFKCDPNANFGDSLVNNIWDKLGPNFANLR